MTSTTKKLSVEQMRRLTLVRHLYNTAVIQSREADVRSGLAVLPFHDAAEMFLQLACEQHEASKKKQAEFADYWSWLSEKGIKLTQSEGMKRLNKVRVSLKHHGILPAPLVMEGLRAEITNFFQDNTPIAFGFSFDQISITTLIEDEEISTLLQNAETALAKDDHRNALADATAAFTLALRKHEVNARSASTQRYHHTIKGAALNALSPFHGFHLSDVADRHVRDAIQDVSRAVTSAAQTLSEAIMVIGYGLDFNAYQIFRAHSPVVHEIIGGPVKVDWLQPPTEDKGIVQQCVNFVIDAAVRLKI